MQVSESGLALIRRFEGCELKAYRDVVGVWTIGYGHTRGVKRGDTITQAQADKMLAEDVAAFEAGVQAAIKRPMAQNQFDAMVSLAYNIGIGAFSGSTLVKKLNAGDVQGAADEIPRWNKADGSVYVGLVNRRVAERKHFLGIE